MGDEASETTYVTTRRQLRGIAESFIAGPQFRSAGTIRLAARPDGFTAVSIPLRSTARNSCGTETSPIRSIAGRSHAVKALNNIRNVLHQRR